MYNKKEWIKYYVNDIECDRESIYQTILENKLYQKTINLHKKFDWDKEKNLEFQVNWKEHSTNFCMDTKPFITNFEPASEEYKLLIESMVQTLDCFYESHEHYTHDSAKRLDTAARYCIGLFSEGVMDIDTSYQKLLYKSNIEHHVFLFDIMAFSTSLRVSSNDPQFLGKEFPELVFQPIDLSKLDEHWGNKNKSKVLYNFFSEILKQTNKLQNLWNKIDFLDESSLKEIDRRFNDYKSSLESLKIEALSCNDPSSQEYHQYSFYKTTPRVEQKLDNESDDSLCLIM